MTPHQALDYQVARYREMTCEQRVLTSLRLHELACDMARMGIRRQNPNVGEAEVEILLRKRLELVRAA